MAGAELRCFALLAAFQLYPALRQRLLLPGEPPRSVQLLQARSLSGRSQPVQPVFAPRLALRRRCRPISKGLRQHAQRFSGALAPPRPESPRRHRPRHSAAAGPVPTVLQAWRSCAAWASASAPAITFGFAVMSSTRRTGAPSPARPHLPPAASHYPAARPRPGFLPPATGAAPPVDGPSLARWPRKMVSRESVLLLQAFQTACSSALRASRCKPRHTWPAGRRPVFAGTG